MTAPDFFEKMPFLDADFLYTFKTETNSPLANQFSDKPWAHISYWECNRHVGHKWLPILESSLDVLNNEFPGHPDNKHGRLCLERLVQRSSHKLIMQRYGNDVADFTYAYTCVKTSRDCIGSPTKQRTRLGCEGISLIFTPAEGQVLLTNHSDVSIFVASPCFALDSDELYTDWPVFRVSRSQSLIVFDCTVYERLCGDLGGREWPGKSLFGPMLHISFGKGWGPSFRRPDVTFCPARLEVWLNLPTINSLSSKVKPTILS